MRQLLQRTRLLQSRSKMIVFGLGNPGARYTGTRHNAGFETVERIAARRGLKLRKRCFCCYRAAKDDGLVLVEPLTYMNDSGRAVPSFISDGETYVVVADQIDLPPGKIRIRRGGSSAGHNGLKSMIAALGPDFIRVYIGVGRPAEGVSVPDHVLSRFQSQEDRELVDKAEEKAAEAIEMLSRGEDFQHVVQWANS